MKPILLFLSVKKACFPNVKHKTDLNIMMMLKVLFFSKILILLNFTNIFDKVFLKFFISKALLYLKIFIITKAYFMKLIGGHWW